MSEFDFSDILAEAQKGRSSGESTTERLNGKFRMVAKYATAERTTNSGNRQVSIVWQVVGGPQAEAETWHNIVFSPKSKAIAGRTLLALGFTPEYLTSLAGAENFAQGLLDIADAVVGVEVEMEIKPQASNVAFDEFKVLELVSGPHVGVSAPAPAQAPVIPGYSGPQAQPLGQYAPQAQAPVIPAGGFVPSV